MTAKKPQKPAEAEAPKHRLVDPTAERDRASANREPEPEPKKSSRRK